MIETIQTVVMWLGLVFLMGMCLAVTAINLGRAARKAKQRLRGASVLMVAVALICLIYARKGTVMVNDPYIMNAGSYLTNDVAHVALAAKTPLLPDTTEILVYARQVDLTNATDWVRLEPHLTLAQHPYDYPLSNATNYDVMVAANYTPAPTVHTNGVWQIRGFMIPDTGKAAFPNTRVIKKEEN